jgi:hypothetical protein
MQTSLLETGSISPLRHSAFFHSPEARSRFVRRTPPTHLCATTTSCRRNQTVSYCALPIRTTLTHVSTPPFVDVLYGETLPADSRFPALTKESSGQEIDDRVKEHMATIAHRMGTCALGDVLDSEFRVREAKGGNVRVCDASVFPEPLGAMPSSSVYTLAEFMLI